MATPTVVEVDPNAPQILSPIKDYTFGVIDRDSKRDTESRRSRKHAVEIKNYNEMRTKYQEAQKRLDRMKLESANNRRMLLEMSSVINSLRNISIDYERDESSDAGAPIINVQKKIRAIDEQLKASMMQCGNLAQEKESQSSTIKAQEGQIRTMEEQINVLQGQLKEALKEKRIEDIASERETLDKMNRNGEITSTIKAQEEKIAALEDQVRKYALERNSTFDKQIEVLKGSNEAKYLEIQAMEKKLTMLRSAQNGQTISEHDEHLLKHVSFTPDSVVLSVKKSTTSSESSSRSPSLASISEETSTTSVDHGDIYADDKDIYYSSRSFSMEESYKNKGDEGSHSIKIATSYDDDSVEIMIADRVGGIDVSDVSCTTDESTAASVSFDYVKEYNNAMSLVQELKRENEKLRRNHSQALSNMAQVSGVTSQAEQYKREYEKIAKVLEEQKQSATLANTKYEKLRREHAKMVEDQKEEHAKYIQLMEDYGKIAHREPDLENYDKLKQLHSAVVMKMADLGEENESLLVERNEARKEKEQAEAKTRALSSELDATTAAYKDLQKANDDTSSKINKLTRQCDSFKTKYYELLASDQTMHSESSSQKDERYDMLHREYERALNKLRAVEAKGPTADKLKRDYAESQAKIAVLEQSIKELEMTRDQYHAAEAKVTLLERNSIKAEKAAAAAKKREQQRATHLKDMLSHYKALEKEHEAVSEKLKRLQAVISDHKKEEGPLQLRTVGSWPFGDFNEATERESSLASSERRIKELQQQRDAALEQMSQLEDEICQVRLEKVEASRARKERENDLKVVLGHYHELQKQHEALTIKAEQLEHELMADGTRHSIDTELAVLVEKKEHEEVQASELFELDESSPDAPEPTQDTGKEPVSTVGQLAPKFVTDEAPAMLPVVEEEQRDEEDEEHASKPAEAPVEEKEEFDDGDTEMVSEMPDEEDEKTAVHEAEDRQMASMSAEEACQSSAPKDVEPEASEPEKAEEADRIEDAAVPEPVALEEESDACFVFDMEEFEALVEARHEEVTPNKLDDEDKKEDSDDSVARLLTDMEALKRRKQKRLASSSSDPNARSDMSTVSNVSEGVSLDNSEGTAECSHSGLSDEAPSTSWKDVKIAKLLSELEQAKSTVWALEEKEKSALAQLEITERKLLVASRETDDAKKRQNTREGHLRDTIAQQKRLEREFEQVQETVVSLQEQLEQAKKEARLWEEETKAARTRATNYHNQFKKLQEKHAAAMDIIKKQEQEIEMLGDKQ